MKNPNGLRLKAEYRSRRNDIKYTSVVFYPGTDLADVTTENCPQPYLVSIHNLAPHPKNRDIEDAIKDDIERLAEEEASQSDPHNLSQGSSRDE